MTTVRLSAFRGALAMLSVRMVASQVGLAAAVFLLTLLWLRVPDASVADVAGTLVLGLVVIAVAGGGEALLFLRLCGLPATRWKLLRGALWIALAAVVWSLWIALLDHVRANDAQLAGYLNSRFPASLRNVFSYEHIYNGFEWLWDWLGWIGAGTLAALAFCMTTALKPLREIRKTIFSFTYWITLVLVVLIATTVTGRLVDWAPGHGIGIELLSLIVRLSVVAIVDATLLCLLLAVMAVFLKRSEEA